MAAWTLRLLDGTFSIKCTILCYGCREQTRENKKIKLIYTYTYMLTWSLIRRKWRLTSLFLFE